MKDSKQSDEVMEAIKVMKVERSAAPHRSSNSVMKTASRPKSAFVSKDGVIQMHGNEAF
jgi:hypothetical protein